jgi:hypothetical protein
MDKNNILIDLSESEKTKFGKADFATQSTPQKVFSSIWAVESEVNNGGFSQYFLNSGSAETASFVVHALDAIGAPLTAAICRRAIDCVFPLGCQPRPTQFARQPERLQEKRWSNWKVWILSFASILTT